MSVANTRKRGWLAFAVACAVLLTLVVPFAGVALADPDNADPNLQITPEQGTNPTGTLHTLTATLTGTGAAAGVEIDFEIDCTSGCSGATYTRTGTTGAEAGAETGGSVSAFDAPVDGDQTPGTADDTRDTPELSCTTTATGGAGGGIGCHVVYSRNNVGSELVAGWVDQNKTNEANDSDTTEGRDEATTPGATTEEDDTDVVEKNWFSAASANVVLDCRDDDATDTETNPPGQPEVYTCRAYNNAGTVGTPGDDTNVSGQVIDAENLTGANDPDNGQAAGTADYNNACTTGADGTCQFTLTPSENETGAASVCFWIDEDNDTQFAPAGAEFDGGGCGEGVTADEPETNKTDVVTKTWAPAAATTLDAEPERDSNVKGTQHTVTATVRDQFGNTVANVPVDFTVTGANVGQGCNNVLTNAQGVATCTYTDSTTVTGPEPETDTIDVRVDGTAGVAEGVDVVDADLQDTVEKFWFTTIPTANSLIVDMTDGDDCNDAADSTATNPINTNHDLCGIVYAGPGATNPVAGANVTLTVSGPGNFVNEGTTTGNTGAARDDDTSRGQTITVTTDATGVYRATITSTTTGTTTVTATSGSASDTGTKTWTAGAARTLDCEPETATNPSGTQHVFTCTARDRFGNPTSDGGEDDTVSFTETGPGRITSATTVTLGSNGQAEVVVQTAATESGDQTVTGVLDSDDDDITPLNRGDNNESSAAEDDFDATDNDECDALAGQTAAGATDTGAPAGVCGDSVVKTWGDAGPTGPQCSNGVDDDTDGFTDFPDDPDCDSVEDDSEADVGGRFATNLTIRYDGDAQPPAFLGKAGSARRECKQGRRVILKKVVPGPNRTVGTDTTNRRGNWRITKRRARGRYYAVVRQVTKVADSGATLVCGRDRSVTIRITR